MWLLLLIVAPFRSKQSVGLFVVTVIVLRLFLGALMSDSDATLPWAIFAAYVLLTLIAVSTTRNAEPSQHQQASTSGPGSGADSQREASTSYPHADWNGLEEDFATLGVSPTCTDDQLRKAYRKKVSEWHPDKLNNMAPELRQIANDKCAEINAAYERIQRTRATATVNQERKENAGSVVYCNYCRQPISDAWSFCRACGKETTRAAESAEEPDVEESATATPTSSFSFASAVEHPRKVFTPRAMALVVALFIVVVMFVVVVIGSH